MLIKFDKVNVKNLVPKLTNAIEKQTDGLKTPIQNHGFCVISAHLIFKLMPLHTS